MDAKLIERSQNEPNYRLLAALSIFFFQFLNRLHIGNQFTFLLCLELRNSAVKIYHFSIV